MQRVPGSASADVLVGIGLTRDDVIRGLVREIGMDEDDAVRAWESVVTRLDADLPRRRIAVVLDEPPADPAEASKAVLRANRTTFRAWEWLPTGTDARIVRLRRRASSRYRRSARPTKLSI
jgi:hypothetical protein